MVVTVTTHHLASGCDQGVGGLVSLRSRPPFPFLMPLCFLKSSRPHGTAARPETSWFPQFAGPATAGGGHLAVQTVTGPSPGQ